MQAAYNTNRLTDAGKDDRSAAVPAANVTMALETTDGIFSSYICRQYPDLTPDYTGTMPTVIVRQAALYSAGIELQRQGPRAPWMEDILSWLKDVAAGDAVIAGQTSGGLADSTTRTVEREFTNKSMDELGEPSPTYMEDGDENDPEQP